MKSAKPTSSPWGKLQSCDKVADGIYWVTTASHGGVLVDSSLAAKLSSYARSTGKVCCSGGFLAFEEDCDWAIPFFELKLPYEKPDAILSTICYWHQQYANSPEVRGHLSSEQIEILDRRLADLKQEEVRSELLKNKDTQLITAASSVGSPSDFKRVFRIDVVTPEDLLESLSARGQVLDESAIMEAFDEGRSLCAVWTADELVHIVKGYPSGRGIITKLSDCDQIVFSSSR